jgi:hypothetical protein
VPEGVAVEVGEGSIVAVGEFVGSGIVAVGAGPGVAVAGAAQDEMRITARQRTIRSFMKFPLIDVGCWQKLYFTTP